MIEYYRIVKTDERVGIGEPALRTRFRRRADRLADRLNAEIPMRSYRWEVAEVDGRYEVVAMQNRLEPLPPSRVKPL